MHKCPDCGVETKHKWLNKFDGTSEKVGMCPQCFRITKEGDLPIEPNYDEDSDDSYLEGEFE